MLPIRLSELARLDLIDIVVFISEGSPAAADRFLDGLDRELARLAQNPFLGRSREELLPRLRSIALGNYLIFYRPGSSDLEVVRIVSGYRDLEALFEQ